MCVVSKPTGSPAGQMGERDKENCSSPCLCLAGQWEWGGLRCGGQGQNDPSNHDLPQDPGFCPANTVLSQHGCSKASRGCIPLCFSSGTTAQVSFLAGPAFFSSCSNSKVLYPSQVCKWVGNQPPKGNKEFFLSCTTPGMFHSGVSEKTNWEGQRGDDSSPMETGMFRALRRRSRAPCPHQTKRASAALTEVSQLAYEAL